MSLHRTSFALGVLAVMAVACSESSPTVPTTNSQLAGLEKAAITDTSGTTGTGPQNTDPGYFRGTVVGQAVPGPGVDTIASAPRLPNVAVTIYTQVGTGSDVQPGVQMGSTATGADGTFQLPTLPAGNYVVTFVPPPGSIYAGVYAFGPLNGTSSNYAWWVTLSKK